MIRRGLIEIVPKASGGFKNYRVSAYGIQMAKILENIEREYKEICSQQGIDDGGGPPTD